MTLDLGKFIQEGLFIARARQSRKSYQWRRRRPALPWYSPRRKASRRALAQQLALFEAFFFSKPMPRHLWGSSMESILKP